ncbi:hypothetical protein E4T56_gene12404 [Termitomyces sp. T112]|nr:hypothetical protein E4T56_gene12404 [Termitomyces sp. T112]
MLETPSRVWRRIEAVEDRDMPSLPSLPGFDDSNDPDPSGGPSDLDDDSEGISPPVTSTPAPASSNHTMTSTIRPSSSTSSTARFASSIVTSRSMKSSLQGPASSRRGSFYSRKGQPDSFDISKIPSLPDISTEPWVGQDSDENEITDEDSSGDSVPDTYLPPVHADKEGEKKEISLSDDLPIERTGSPRYLPKSIEYGGTPKKNYDYSVSLRSEPKASPFDKYRNVALRKSAMHTRTPSLSRTTSSRTTSPAQSTPHSIKSFVIPSHPHSPATPSGIPLPRSNTTSPISRESQSWEENSSGDEHAQSLYDTGVRSMDITDVQISPPQHNLGSDSDGEERPHEDDAEASSERELEPTFSSDCDPIDTRNPLESPRLSDQSPTHLSSAFTSPSVTFTPRPTYPRPRARFNLPVPRDLLDTPEPSQQENQQDSDEAHQEESQDLDEPLTPSRRRSFLLSVINSTTRPRMKFPTPHPRYNHHLATPNIVQSTPGPEMSSIGPRTSLQTAFAGVTPRPRLSMNRNSRPSHPLSQTFLPLGEGSDSDSAPATFGLGSGSGLCRRQSLDQWAPTSGNLSPYDGAQDLISFISTASSHDLTTHHRVNTSFDPAMGFGAGAGQGHARFNVGKLNNYLHGLNRRLQEENETLIERLRKLEDGKKVPSVSEIAAVEPELVEGRRRVSGGGTRVSMGGTVLGNVVEDVGGEGWGEEKAELEELVDSLQKEKERTKEEKEKIEREKESIEQELKREREGRMKDKESWKRRMVEVEEGVGVIIKDLETKIEIGEKKAQDLENENSRNSQEMKRRLMEAEEERDAARERVEQAECLLENGKELGGELREANERTEKLTTELRKAQVDIQELEKEVMQSNQKIDERDKDLRELHDIVKDLKCELGDKNEELIAERTRTEQMDQEMQELEKQLEAMNVHLAEMEDGAVIAVDRIEALEEDLQAANDEIRTLTVANEEASDKVEKLESDALKAQELAQQMEHALEEAEKKMLADDAALNDLTSKIASVERERDRARDASSSQDTSHSGNVFSDAGVANAEIEALESELDSANREIARLNTLLNQSPARKAMEKARDAKVGLLEREKEELLERNKTLRMALNEFNTPNKMINTSGISPIHRQVLSMSLRTPKTPGAPLRDLSWLNTTFSDPTVSPLVAEINRLQKELDRANESIDDKLDKLEDAGLGVVGLTKKLEDARAEISIMENEVARLSRREERRFRRLEKVRCQKCHIKIDVLKLNQLDESTLEMSRDDLPTEPPTPITKTSEALRADLQSVNAHLEALKKEWVHERRILIGEKAVLQDATNRLNAQMKTTKDEMRKVVESSRAAEKTAINVQEELDKAKRVIADLEADLKSERSQLRGLTAKQNQIRREKAGILSQLQRTESDMDDVKRHLQKYKQENHNLEKELRENANIEQKARVLEGRVIENAETIENLRQERSLLATDYKALQQRFAAISEEADRLRVAYNTSSTSHENRRQQLDLHLLEINDLRRALSNKTDELHKADQEKRRVSMERSDVAKTVAALEADLRRVKKDAEAFGRDLKHLRAEKEKEEERHKEEIAQLERAKKQTQTQIRLLNEQLDNQRSKTGRAREELKNHVCAADERQLTALKAQHNQESKGLFVQIRYLKAKFTRESSFRSDLAYQKNHLLVLLAQFEKSEQTIFASIAKIGFPVSLPPPIKRRRKLKSLAIAAIFLLRASRARKYWQEHVKARQSVTNALQDVRRRRMQSS